MKVARTSTATRNAKPDHLQVEQAAQCREQVQWRARGPGTVPAKANTLTSGGASEPIPLGTWYINRPLSILVTFAVLRLNACQDVSEKGHLGHSAGFGSTCYSPGNQT